MATAREFLESIVSIAHQLQGRTDVELEQYHRDLKTVDEDLGEILTALEEER